MAALKIKMELVTSSNRELFKKLEDESHQEKNSLWFQHLGWYSPSNTENSWNDENYIIFSGSKKPMPVGYFTFTKYHQDSRVLVNGFYLSPKCRGKSIVKHIVLFIGNRVFGELGYNRIEASAWALNKNVVNLYDSILNREGVRKEHYRFNRKFHSRIDWDILYKDSIWNGKTELKLSDIEERLKK